MSMNAKQVRVVDPILTTVARGYQNQQYIGHKLFPIVYVGISGGQILEFNKESWRKYNLRRAPGADVVEIDYGYAGKPYALKQDSVHGKVPREHLRDASAMPGIQLGTIATNNAMEAIRRSQEIEQATLARDASRYATANKVDLTASSWRNPARNPIADIIQGKQVIADSTGKEPNILTLSGDAWNALSSNPHTLGLFTRGEVEQLVITPQLLAAKLDLTEIAIGRSTYIDANNATVKTWGTDAVLAYTEIGSMSNALPSYGYTYTLNDNPVVEQTWYNQSNKSWMYPVNNEYDPVIAGADAGYLFIGAGAPFTG